MPNLKIVAMLVGGAVSASAALATPDYIGLQSPYNDVLVWPPATHPGNTVDSPHRQENGRVWVGRAVGEHQTRHAPGAEAYGAARSESDQLIYVRVKHTTVAISPWNRIDNGGLRHLEHARNVWLKDNGYIQSVRTFVNPLYHRSDEAEVSEASLPAPRATIRRNAIPKGPDKLQVMRPVSGQPITRISTPDPVIHKPRTEIAEAAENAGD